MNILVTGGTGFVGSHMIDYILKYAIKPDQKIYCTKVEVIQNGSVAKMMTT